MVLGIGIIQAAFLRRVYICPGGATCPHSFNPNSDVLQGVRTFAEYWLQVGTIIAGCGLAKLIAYQSWISMKQQGLTVEVLDLNIGAIKGNFSDATKLLTASTRKRDRLLGMFALSQFAITITITLVVGLATSSITGRGRVRLDFTYPTNFTLPYTAVESYSIFHKLEGWLFVEDQSLQPAHNFRGTFVVQDNRTVYGIDTQPTGPRIMGNVSCTGMDISIVTVNSSPPSYNVSYHGPAPFGKVDAILTLKDKLVIIGARPDQEDSSVSYILWASSVAGAIPNATAASDGKLHSTVCKHFAWMAEIPTIEGSQNQSIQHSVPVDNPLAGGEDSSCGDKLKCLSILAHRFILFWWHPPSFVGAEERPIFCKSGVLSKFSQSDEQCRVDSETWTSTLAVMLDAMVQSTEKSGTSMQQLWAHTESISTRRWWLQGVIPLATFLLYIMGLGHVVRLNTGDGTPALKELTVVEVIGEAYMGERQGQPVTESTRLGGA